MQLQVDATTSPNNTDASKKLAVASHDETKHEEDLQVLDHFVVRAMNAENTPDEIRANVDRALQTLSLLIREYPTLPADPQDPTHHLTYSTNSDCALKLPHAHCAFRGCCWTGASHDDLVSHFQNNILKLYNRALQLCKQK